MLDIEAVEFQNFLSYGDYLTTIPLNGLGPCLILGHNGAGKSTIVNAILYTMFGRTMHAAAPGDCVINNQTGTGCLTRVRLKNGDTITRTRRLAGHNELLVERGGEQLLATLSTTSNQQAQLNRLYNLDWQVFCNTSFLTQLGRTWFEMPEPQRKREIERAMRLDRYTLRAQVAKEKVEKATAEQALIKQKLDALQHQIDAATSDLDDAIAQESDFETNRATRVAEAVARARDYKKQYDDLPASDIEGLRTQWTAVEAAQQKLRLLESKARQYQLEVAAAETAEREAGRRMTAWRVRTGKVCSMCEQEVASAHVSIKVEPLIEEQRVARATADTARAAYQQLLAKVAAVAEAIATARPALSLREAEAVAQRRATLYETARRWAEQARRISTESNPHGLTIDKLRARIAAAVAERDQLAVAGGRLDALVRHYGYIWRAYNDRRRIKSFGVAKFRPHLNNRLRYYLDKFKLDINIEITDALGVETNGAGYNFMSGGERKRVDVSLMLARFDLEEAIYGRQSNVLVLDEVDGRLDEEGVRCLSDIILNDLVSRVDAVLVISHRSVMQDVFPRQITVERYGPFSSINEIR